MNESELQKQQKQFIHAHDLALDRERMMAKPTWTWFEFLAFMNFLDYQKIDRAFPGEGVWLGVEKDYPQFKKLWSDILGWVLAERLLGNWGWASYLGLKSQWMRIGL